MSENLKKLREREKKIAEKFIDRQRRKVTLPHWHERYGPLAGMSQIEDLERKAGEARKEEQQVKEELKETEEEYKMKCEELRRKFLKNLKEMLEEEKTAVRLLDEIGNIAKTLGFDDIAADIWKIEQTEGEHYRILNSIFNRVSKG